MSPFRFRVALLAILAAIIVPFARPLAVDAHAELVSSNPANGASVPSPFTGPIVLTYDEALKSGSHAELIGQSGAKTADAAVDPANAARLVFTLAAPLAAGAWTIQWTSVAADGDVERGQLRFTVLAPTPTLEPLPPTLAPTASPGPSPTPTVPPSPSPALASPSPSPSPSPPPASTADVIVPIVAALALVAIAGLFLLRRRGGAG